MKTKIFIIVSLVIIFTSLLISQIYILEGVENKYEIAFNNTENGYTFSINKSPPNPGSSMNPGSNPYLPPNASVNSAANPSLSPNASVNSAANPSLPPNASVNSAANPSISTSSRMSPLLPIL